MRSYKDGETSLRAVREFSLGNDGPERLETLNGRLHVYYRTGGNSTRRAALVSIR